ncbi:MAG: 5'/3'-nucleotidase SurE [Rectinemataceae bacterium]
MRILVTNDDGIDADGISELIFHLEALKDPSGAPAHEIWVIAPDSERSGVSHAMTLRKPTKVRKLGERRFSCSGTPADCVILAGLGIMEGKPDLVISGINHGPNLGTDIVYSGTCGAARQAALVGVPAIAVSCAAYSDPMDYSAGASFVAANIVALVGLWKPDAFVNINAPSAPAGRYEAKWTVPGRNKYMDKLKCFDGADGYTYCFLTAGDHERHADPVSDHHVVTDGYIAISLIGIHPESVHDESLNGQPVFGVNTAFSAPPST